MVGQPVIDHARAELRAQVDRQMGHAHAVGQRARAANRLRRAAAQIAIVFGIGPQLERHPDGLRARPSRRAARPPRCRHRRSCATSIRSQAGASVACSRAAAPSARCSASAASSAAWRLAGLRPTELRRDLLGADPRRAEQRSAPQEPDRRAARRDGRATAAGVETGVRDPPVCAVGVDGDRDADQIAARRPAGGARAGALGQMTPTERSFEMMGQVVRAAHAVECRSGACALRRSPARSRTRL